MSPTPIPTQCEGCSSKFSWLRKRRTCLMCRSVCCSSCMQRLRLCGVGRQCLRCARLAGVRYERAALQQMTVRDLKHIMKIVDVSSATCREKSDLVDTILMCSESGGRSGSPAVEADVPLSTAAPAAAAAHRPWRVRPGDSIRVGPLESIRVRAMDGVESPLSSKESPAPDRSSGGSSSSATLGFEESDNGFVMVDVETSGDGTDGGDDAVRSVEVDAAADRPVEVDVEGFVETERLSNVEEDAPVNLGLIVDGSSVVEAASASDDEVIVDDDPDEPQSESVTIEVDKDDDENGVEPVSETDVDLSRMTDVAQIPSEDLISRLTVRQCKQLLQHRRTDYRNVIEKEELLRRVRELWRETKRNSEALASAPDRDICKICMDSLVDCVMLECGHMATCTACGKQMSECPICRKYVVRVVHVFRS